MAPPLTRRIGVVRVYLLDMSNFGYKTIVTHYTTKIKLLDQKKSVYDCFTQKKRTVGVR